MHAFVIVSGSVNERRLTGTLEMARIINDHVGYACHRFVGHRPETDPLRGLTFAVRGERIRRKGNELLFSPRPPRRRKRKSGR